MSANIDFALRRGALAAMIVHLALVADDWPRWRGPARDGRWYETGVVDVFESTTLEPLWRLPVSSGYRLKAV